MSTLTPRINKLERNAVINGNFDFWQRVGAANTAFTTGNTGYTADRFKTYNVGPTVKTINIIRSANVPTFVQSGYQSQYSSQFISGTTVPSLASTDYILPHSYTIEGLDYQSLHGKAITISFWVYASVTGTYCFSMNNSNGTRSYVTTYTVSQANTWEQKYINVTLDTAGVWNFDNSVGLNIYFNALTGSTYQTSTFNQWQSANVFGATTATNYMATASASISIAQVSMVYGTITANNIFLRRGVSVDQEQNMCQRYYAKSSSGVQFYGIRFAGTSPWITIRLPIDMRASPTVSNSFSTIFTSAGTINNVTNNSQFPDYFTLNVLTSNTSVDWGINLTWAADADF